MSKIIPILLIIGGVFILLSASNSPKQSSKQSIFSIGNFFSIGNASVLKPVTDTVNQIVQPVINIISQPVTDVVNQTTQTISQIIYDPTPSTPKGHTIIISITNLRVSESLPACLPFKILINNQEVKTGSACYRDDSRGVYSPTTAVDVSTLLISGDIIDARCDPYYLSGYTVSTCKYSASVDGNNVDKALHDSTPLFSLFGIPRTYWVY